jgi:hypothetical protein
MIEIITIKMTPIWKEVACRSNEGSSIWITAITKCNEIAIFRGDERDKPSQNGSLAFLDI